jgi:cellulose synthase/poly-beta-1,6-N-acetylglucosamine synthase-like glycosyltransferase
MAFDILVPAHNEESGITRTVESLLAVDYPPRLFRVLVVADNCTDRTAERARAAGAQVIVRDEDTQLGKGYALATGFASSLADAWADAVVVVDADTVVSSNLLSAFAVRFEQGADVVQADYGVLNPRSSWRTRIMTIALAAFHGVRSLSRHHLGLSCGLRGNGMGFSTAVLLSHPFRAFSVTEDLEYGILLAYGGHRVEYVHEARVLGQMVDTERASRSQRHRWERGRRALARQYVSGLLRESWRRRDGGLLDLAVDLLVPPLGSLTAFVVAGATICFVLWPESAYASLVWGWSAACLVLYVLRAWALSGVGLVGLVDLLWAPLYVVWKLTLRFTDSRGLEESKKWIRTTRELRM